MPLPTKGAWARKYGQVDPGGTALIWGTGINPIHSYYGSPPDRLSEVRQRTGDIISPHESVPEVLVPTELWGYTPEDSPYTGVEYDDRQPWNVASEDRKARSAAPEGFPPWNASGGYRDKWRARRLGAFRWYQDFFMNAPSETVSEGWINKPKGEPQDAKTSDPGQYERQTSMQQRYQTRDNILAVQRSTDDPRAPIDSRVIGIREKIYSEGERDYDMFPRQQTPEIARPFWYRTAGTADADQMEPNEITSRVAIDRTPPPDPFIGIQDSDQEQLSYGYTGEDFTYA